MARELAKSNMVTGFAQMMGVAGVTDILEAFWHCGNRVKDFNLPWIIKISKYIK